MTAFIRSQRGGETQLALDDYQESVEILEVLLAEDPARVDWLRLLADTHQGVGVLHIADGRTSAGAESLSTSIDLVEQIVAITSDDPEPRNLVSWNRLLLGDVYARSQQPERARELWTQVVEWLEPITATSDNPNYLDTHAQALIRLGRLQESRPLVEDLIAGGWADPQFLELVRRSGLDVVVP